MSRMADTVTSNRSCIAEIYGQDSQVDVVGIRSIMVQQETLFKEQVQALHRLYKVQKLEMMELEERKNHLGLETAELTDGFSSVSELEDKSGELVRPVARVYKLEKGSLSLHPFCSLKLFVGSGPVSFGGSFQRLEGSQSKLVRDFDLERFPDDWVDESVIVIQPDDSNSATKESENACFEDYKSGKSSETSEEGLLTTSSGEVVSSDSEGNQDSSPADPMGRKTKLSHQGSFASVNGCLDSSSSEGEENNSKMAATFKMTEGITGNEVRFPKRKLSYNGQTPPWEGHSKFVLGSADRQSRALKTTSGAARLISYEKAEVETPLYKSEENKNTQQSTAAGTSAGLEPNKSVQHQPDKAQAEATDFHASSNESSKPSKRKHWNVTIAADTDIDKLRKCAKSAKTIPNSIP